MYEDGSTIYNCVKRMIILITLPLDLENLSDNEKSTSYNLQLAEQLSYRSVCDKHNTMFL